MGGVADQVDHVLLQHPLLERLVGVDHHEGHPLGPELARCGAPDAPESADDEVVPQPVDPSLHPPPPPMFGEYALGHPDRHEGEGDQEQGDAQDHEADREDLPRVVEWTNLPEPHGRQGQEGHVEGVDEGPVHQHVPRDAVDEDDDQEHQRPSQPSVQRLVVFPRHAG